MKQFFLTILASFTLASAAQANATFHFDCEPPKDVTSGSMVVGAQYRLQLETNAGLFLDAVLLSAAVVPNPIWTAKVLSKFYDGDKAVAIYDDFESTTTPRTVVVFSRSLAFATIYFNSTTVSNCKAVQ